MVTATVADDKGGPAESQTRRCKAEITSGRERPSVAPVNLDAIPGALKALPRWVVWRWHFREPENGKPGQWTKPPLDAKARRNAAVDDPTTWATFEEAVKAYRVKGYGLDGLGFMLGEGIVGVDLDDCRDPDTGELTAESHAIIERFGSYADVSPTGTGVKLFCRSDWTVPVGQNRTDLLGGGHVEVYSFGRYFTITGQRIGSNALVEERTPELCVFHRQSFPNDKSNGSTGSTGGEGAAVFAAASSGPESVADDELLDRIRASRRGKEFERLWAGDAGSDASSADMSLCNILAWWTAKDSGRMDRLFRQSGLKRDKWGEVHSSDGRTYGEMTVAKAIADTEESWPGPRLETEEAEKKSPSKEFVSSTTKMGSETKFPPPVPATKLVRKSAEGIKWIWKGYLASGFVTILSGLPKGGKTTLLKHLLKILGEGGSLCGKPVSRARVYYASEEPDEIWISRRDAVGIGDWVEFQNKLFKRKPDVKQWYAFLKHVAAMHRKNHYDLVVIDTITNHWPVKDENDAGPVSEAMMPLAELTELELGVLLVHHLRKSDGAEGTGARGSNALTGGVDTFLEMRRNNPTGPDDCKRVLTGVGRWDDETPSRQVIKLTPDEGYILVAGDDEETRLAYGSLLPTAPPGMTIDEILNAWKLPDKPSRPTAFRQLDKGKDAGWWERTGEGKKGDPHRFYRSPDAD